MENRREHKRFQILAEVLIRPMRSKAWFSAVLYNISDGGMGIYSPRPIRKDQKILIKIIYFKDGRTAPSGVENLSGTVRWVHKIGQYRAAGVMFNGNNGS